MISKFWNDWCAKAEEVLAKGQHLKWPRCLVCLDADATCLYKFRDTYSCITCIQETLLDECKEPMEEVYNPYEEERN